MILQKGDIWSVWNITDLLLFTANSTITKDNKLVMGAGIAKEVRDRFPGIDSRIGNLLNELQLANKDFGLLLSPSGKKIGAFQTKIDWKQPSNLELIRKSTLMLLEVSSNYKRIDLCYPGINHGKLNPSDVLPIIQQLPDNVYIWQK